MADILSLLKVHQAGDDWFESSKYTNNEIEKIPDPTGDRKKPTSIPSIFAQFYLIKEAFDYVVNHEMDGDTFYHRLVSEYFDLAELFFRYKNNLEKELEVLKWKFTDIQAGTAGLDLLKNALKLFINQDGNILGIDEDTEFVLLKLKKGSNKVLGGFTNTSVIFFPAPDFSNILNDKLFFQLFGQRNRVLPLYKRSKDFIEKFINYYQNFLDDNIPKNLEFKLANYLDKTINKLDLNKKHIVNLQDIIFNQIEETNYQFPQLAGIEYSDFRIKPKKQINDKDKLPLVLPVQNQADYQNWKYTSDQDTFAGVKINTIDKNSIDIRVLPGRAIQYPYLSVWDFLEDYIMEIPYKINNKDFFVENFENKAVLLPIKPIYFRYFTTEDLKNSIKIIELPAGYQINLDIPVEKGLVRLTKTYKTLPINEDSKIFDPNIDITNGRIIRLYSSFSVFPKFKIPNNLFKILNIVRSVPANYSGQHVLADLDIKFFVADKELTVELENRRSKLNKENKTPDEISYYLTKNFDYFSINLKIGNQIASNIVIPQNTEVKNKKGDFVFAVDFGSVNTHVEYKKDNGNTIPLNYDKSTVVAYSFDWDSDIFEDCFYRGKRDDFDCSLIERLVLHSIPSYISKDNNELLHFPIRTALAESRNYSQNNFSTLSEINIAYYFNMKNYPEDKLITNIKWNNSQSEYIEFFLKEILTLIYAKVIGEGYSVDNSDITIVRFYPLSFPEKIRNLYNQIWDKIIENIFEKQINKYNKRNIKLKEYNESIAPFFFFKEEKGLKAEERPAVTIDIGGETTDILIFKDGKPILADSVRFAGNTIFGDGYGYTLKDNGFVQFYKDKVLSINNLPYSDILQKFINDAVPSDVIINFYFGLENKITKKAGVRLNFYSDILISDLRVIIYIFYIALIYYMGKILISKNIETPQDIAFSGNGAKLLLFNDEIRKKIANIIFKELGFEKKLNDIKLIEEPKAATAKGGIYMVTDNHFENLDQIQFTWSIVDHQKTINEIYKNKEDISKIYNEFKEFKEITLQVLAEIGVERHIIEKIDKLFSSDVVLEYIKSGLDDYKKISGNDDKVKLNETPFFYPLKGLLHDLAVELIKN